VTSAAATAAQVLTWAGEPSGPVPTGPLWDVAQLAGPPDAVRDAAVQLARRTAARLGAGAPPFGALHRIGPGALFLAAAAGGRKQPGPAALLARAVPPGTAVNRHPGAWYDLVARHGVVGAVVTSLDGTEDRESPGTSAKAADDGEQEPLTELLLAASPLTAVLYRPTLRALRSDTTGQAVTTAVALLSRPRGQAVLAAELAGWTPLPHVLAWRASLLTRLRHQHPDLLLDVYFTARTRHAPEWDKRVSWAARQLGLHRVADPLAIATIRFWAPLAAMERDAPLSRLRPLLSGQDRALTLVRRFRLDRGAA
jgi:FtsH ternary system domain X1